MDEFCRSVSHFSGDFLEIRNWALYRYCNYTINPIGTQTLSWYQTNALYTISCVQCVEQVGGSKQWKAACTPLDARCAWAESPASVMALGVHQPSGYS